MTSDPSTSARIAPALDLPLTLRILTINAHKGFGFLNRGFVLHELREAVRASRADLVFLQEVLGAHASHARRYADWPAQPQYEFLADSMWPQFAYGRNAVYPQGDHGNALLSRYPIARHDNIDVSVGKHERRGLLHCALALPGIDVGLHAICVHLGLREHQRRAQIGRLIDYVATSVPLEEPLIVAGDFNDWRGRIGDELAEIGLREVFAVRRNAPARTFPARFPLLPLDRIYVRGLQIEDAAVLDTRPWSHLSDHAALLSQVRL